MPEPTPSPTNPSPATPDTPAPPLPVARLEREPRWTWFWLLPLAAAAFVGWTVWQTWAATGPRITISFSTGHGLKVGDVLRFRGVNVGDVTRVAVAADLERVEVDMGLTTEGAALARAGSRFWIVRPRVDLTGVEGLDTIVGANYVAVIPGDGPPQTQFEGHEEPPIGERIEQGGLEIVLQAAARGSLRPGAAIRYRQVRVGTVLTVGLAADASLVEARAYIRPAFRELVRQNSRFWDAGGVELNAGWLSGISVGLDSAESLVAGGIAFATPTEPGAKVSSGQRFGVASRSEPEWLAWSPALPVGSHLLPAGAELPQPQRAVLAWRHEGTLWDRNREQQGWIVPIEGGYLGPENLLTMPERAVAGSAHLAAVGKIVPLAGGSPLPNGLAYLASADVRTPWPRSRVRAAALPEDALVIAGRTESPVLIAAPRFQPGAIWTVDPAIAFDPTWHGASVLATSDGALIGVLLLSAEGARVAPVKLPEK